MRTKPGFIQIQSQSQREETPYDNFKGELVRIDIAGGIGLAGKLDSCEVQNSGYAFSLNPSIVYHPDGKSRISEKKSVLESNGNALSVIEIEDDIREYILEINKAMQKNKDSKK